MINGFDFMSFLITRTEAGNLVWSNFCDRRAIQKSRHPHLQIPNLIKLITEQLNTCLIFTLGKKYSKLNFVYSRNKDTFSEMTFLCQNVELASLCSVIYLVLNRIFQTVELTNCKS